jgi:hypothetical protein
MPAVTDSNALASDSSNDANGCSSTVTVHVIIAVRHSSARGDVADKNSCNKQYLRPSGSSAATASIAAACASSPYSVHAA